MEKIILAIHQKQVNIVTVDFACWLAELTGSTLSAAILRSIDYQVAVEIPPNSAHLSLPRARKSPLSDETIISEAPGTLLINACAKRGISLSIPSFHGSTTDELISASRFSDLIILDREISVDHRDHTLPSPLLKTILSQIECPVVIAPINFNDIDEIFFACDGSADSLYAIKHFTYLLPQLTEKKVAVLQVNHKLSGILHQTEIVQWLHAHYQQVSYRSIEGVADEQLCSYLVGHQNAILIMGSYGRKFQSESPGKRTADLLIRNLNLPIFIAHK